MIYASHGLPGQAEVDALSTAGLSGLEGNRAKDQAPIKQAEGASHLAGFIILRVKHFLTKPQSGLLPQLL